MKKVLILAYFYPPSNFAGSYRAESWAKYLKQYGYYPIIVTRQWNKGQSGLTDTVINNELEVQYAEGYEVHRVPYHQSLRDKLHAKYGESGWRFFRKLLSLFELVFQNFLPDVIPYHNIYEYSNVLMSKQKDIDIILATGRPFQIFSFADKLSRKHNIPWCADYRDEWSTCQWIKDYSLLNRFISWLESISEKRWLNKASSVISCSDYMSRSIGYYNHKPFFTVLNGFDPDSYKVEAALDQGKVLNMLYNGTLYATQPVELLIDALKQIWNDPQVIYKPCITFQGIKADPNQLGRLEQSIKGYEQYIVLGERVSKEEVIRMQKSADVLVMLGHVGVKGNYSSKIFEYIACERPILLAPGDNDVLSELILKANLGREGNNVGQISAIIEEWISMKASGQAIPYLPNEFLVQQYTREAQAKVLAEVLNRSEKLESNKLDNYNIGRSAVFNAGFKLGMHKFLSSKLVGNKLALCFHRISYESDSVYPPLHPHVFKGLIEYISKNYQVVGLSDWSGMTRKPKLMLTFDDGYLDFYEIAYPILCEYGLPSLLAPVLESVLERKPFWTQRIGAIINDSVHYKRSFRNPNTGEPIFCGVKQAEYWSLRLFEELVSKPIHVIESYLASEEKGRMLVYPDMLEVSHLKKMITNGVEIVSHSYSHAYLSFDSERGDYSRFEKELIDSKKIIEDISGGSCRAFAAPSGFMHPNVTKFIKEQALYDFCLTTEGLQNTDAYSQLPRIINRVNIYGNSISENVFRINGFHQQVKQWKSIK